MTKEIKTIQEDIIKNAEVKGIMGSEFDPMNQDDDSVKKAKAVIDQLGYVITPLIVKDVKTFMLSFKNRYGKDPDAATVEEYILLRAGEQSL